MGNQYFGIACDPELKVAYERLKECQIRQQLPGISRPENNRTDILW